MPQDYKITEPNFRNSPLNGTANNYIPYRPTNTLNSIVGPLFRIPAPTVSQILLDNLPVYQIKPITEERDEPKFKSKLGTPIMDVLIFGAPNIMIGQKPISSFDSIEIEGILYIRLYDVLITVNQAKKIVITEISGNNGSVKEFVGFDDFQITITGRLTGNYNQRPAQQLIDLKQYLDLNTSIRLSSDYLDNLGIDEVVITSYDFPQTQGEYSTQYFTINAVSDSRPEDFFLKFTPFPNPAPAQI